MKTFTSEYAAHVLGPVTTLAICWKITKNNGDVILGTNHDRNIVISETNIGVAVSASSGFDLVGTYAATSGITGSDIKSSSDMSVDNMEVQGAVKQPDMVFDDVSVADIEAGLLDAAQVTTFRLNWKNPDNYQEVLRHGVLGELNRTSEGRYIEEALGLTQVLQQMIGRTCGDRCDVAEFGDIRCKLDVAALAVTGTVTTVVSKRRFGAAMDFDSAAADQGYFNLGKLTFTSGANDGFTKQVKNDSVGSVEGEFDMWEVFPNDVLPGDQFSVIPGCDRRYETCRDVFNNLVNFRGPGIFTPGMDQIIRAP